MARRLGVIALVALTACGGPSGSPGEEVFYEFACQACHGDEDSTAGPTLNGLWGSEVLLEDGRSVTADEAYVRRAITDPLAEVRAGYRTVMPGFPLSDGDVDTLMDYIRSLG